MVVILFTIFSNICRPFVIFVFVTHFLSSSSSLRHLLLLVYVVESAAQTAGGTACFRILARHRFAVVRGNKLRVSGSRLRQHHGSSREIIFLLATKCRRIIVSFCWAQRRLFVLGCEWGVDSLVQNYLLRCHLIGRKDGLFVCAESLMMLGLVIAIFVSTCTIDCLVGVLPLLLLLKRTSAYLEWIVMLTMLWQSGKNLLFGLSCFHCVILWEYYFRTT